MLDFSTEAENKKILIFLSGKFKQQIVLLKFTKNQGNQKSTELLYSF